MQQGDTVKTTRQDWTNMCRLLGLFWKQKTDVLRFDAGKFAKGKSEKYTTDAAVAFLLAKAEGFVTIEKDASLTVLVVALTDDGRELINSWEI